MIQQAQLPAGQKQAIPADVYQLTAAYNLGTVVKEYKNNAVVTMLSGILLSVFAGGGALLLGYLVAAIHPASSASFVFLWLCALLLLGYGISLCGRGKRCLPGINLRSFIRSVEHSPSGKKVS